MHSSWYSRGSPGEPDTLSNGFAFKEIQHVFLEYFWKYGGVRQWRDHYPVLKESPLGDSALFD